MEKRFEKGSREMLMFREYFELIQKFWIVERGDAYWNEFIDETLKFEQAFRDIPLARQLVTAFVNTQERSYKNGKALPE